MGVIGSSFHIHAPELLTNTSFPDMTVVVTFWFFELYFVLIMADLDAGVSWYG
jgi:hypothetical protein